MATETYLNSTLAYCPSCQRTELARIVVREAQVFMERVCPVQGTQRIKIVEDYHWYVEKMAAPQMIASPTIRQPVVRGCPHDCGLCEFHTAKIHLPVLSITNDCNLHCPICFTYNRPDQKYYKSAADMQTIVNHIVAQTGGVELINITGGEPTLHPHLFDLLAICQHPKIGRITMNTNGLKIAQDLEFAKKIKAAGVQLVLSLDTLDPHQSKLIHGKDLVAKKLRVLQILEELQIPTTLLSVCIKGVNEEEVANLVHTYLKKDFVCSITIQNMTFTGQQGSQFKPRAHITIDEVEQLLARRGEMSQADFFPLGSYHPLCYSVAYYIVQENKILSLTRLIDKAILTAASQNSYLLNTNQDFSAQFQQGINRLWAAGEDEGTIKRLKELLQELYPKDRNLTALERLNIAEKRVKMVYIHPHMDDDNFDIDRVSRCGDVVPDESGRMVPACAYNLLHRKQDTRFWVEPPSPLNRRTTQI